MQGSQVASISDVDRHPLLDESLDLILPVLPGSEQEGRLPALPGFQVATSASGSVRFPLVLRPDTYTKRGGSESRFPSMATVFTKVTVGLGQFLEVSARCDRKIRQPKE